jgi:hypothetical protein
MALTGWVHTESMSTRTTLALAIAAGFIGGVASQRILPTPVRAQEQASVPQEVRAHKFVLVDEAGVNRGVFGFNKEDSPRIQLMEANGRIWGLTLNGYARRDPMLPDATCTSCPRKPAKKGAAASQSGAPSH